MLFARIFSWLGRHLLALGLILVILIAGRLLWPTAQAWIADQRAVASGDNVAKRDAYAAAAALYAEYARTRRVEAARQVRALRALPADRLQARLRDIPPRRTLLARDLRGNLPLALAAARGDSGTLFAHYRAGAEIRLLGQEEAYVRALLGEIGARRDIPALQQRRAAAARAFAVHEARRVEAARRAQALNRRPLSGPRNFLCANLGDAARCPHYREKSRYDAIARMARDAREAARFEHQRLGREIAARRAFSASAGSADLAFADSRRRLDAQVARLDETIGSNWILWVQREIGMSLGAALLILLAGIFAPMAFKAFAYFVLAPIASRRDPIRLLAGEQGEASDGGRPSGVSQKLRLRQGHELLVVPDAVQSSPHSALKRTKWLLRWDMPFSSIAAGLVGLTRFRYREADFVAVSATGDPFQEVGLIDIPAGSAVVIKPRALRGLAQPIASPVRITRHWRLAHLSAWLTFQLRFLVVHGPCTLIVQGGRGLRLERAGQGRAVNQAATLGFSAGTLYSVRRCEAFGAYLMGKQGLLNDAFDGSGWYFYEEMPRAGDRRGIWGRGLKGLGDAVLRVFGI